MTSLSRIRISTSRLAIALSLTAGLAACATTTPDSASSSPPNASESTEQVSSAEPSDDTAEAATKFYAKDGVAIGGADPVAYFTEETYQPGSSAHTYEWQGVTWQFTNAENRDLFAANPNQYAPQYGGHCAWAVAAKNALVPIDPNAWSVVDNKLYLNANKRVQSTWEKDISGFIAQANQNWPALSL